MVTLNLNTFLVYVRRNFDGFAYGMVVGVYVLMTGGILAFIGHHNALGSALIGLGTAGVVLLLFSLERKIPYALSTTEAQSAVFTVNAAVLAVFALILVIHMIGWVDLLALIAMSLLGGFLWHPVKQSIETNNTTSNHAPVSSATRVDDYRRGPVG